MDIFSFVTLFDGLAFFLYGMRLLSESLKKTAGGKLEKLLNKATDNKFKGLAVGAIITIAIQSSSAMTVMLVGFVNSGIMDLPQTVGVIFGSDIGTTLTAWILSLAGIDSGDNVFLKLLKPMSFRGYSFWSYIGENIMSFILTFIPTFIIINILTNGSIELGLNLFFFVLSVLMALVLNFSVDMIVATICLYTESTWGINMVKECIVLLLSGASIPLAFFPAGLRNIVQYLPFRCIYDTPLSVLLQKNGYTWGTGLLSSLLLQLGWCIALGLVGAAFWSFSLKKITVNGG